MVLDAQARRAVGVSPMSAADMTGSRTKDGRGVNLPETSSGNPGPTANLRGIEPNTSIDWAGNTTDPEIQVNVAGELPVSAVLSPPFDTPDSSGLDTDGDSPEGWQTYDSSAKNSVGPDWPQVGSFSKFKEDYPGSGGWDE